MGELCGEGGCYGVYDLSFGLMACCVGIDFLILYTVKYCSKILAKGRPSRTASGEDDIA